MGHIFEEVCAESFMTSLWIPTTQRSIVSVEKPDTAACALCADAMIDSVQIRIVIKTPPLAD
jgi:hypothetical protein